MAETVTKTCPICFSVVDARAKKCPHCQSLLGFYKVVVAALVFVCLFGAIGFIALIAWATNSRPRSSRAGLPDVVTIVSSQRYFAPGYQNQSGKIATIVGSLRNDSDKILRHVDLEVRFYNAKNELIDLFEGSHHGPIKAQEETPFKISDNVNIHLPEADYATHKLVVKHAYSDK